MQDDYLLTGKLNEDCTAFLFDNPLAVSRVLKSWKGIDLISKISKLFSKRSNQQNRYLHGVIVPYIRNFHKATQGGNISINQCKAYIYTKVLDQEIVIEQVFGKEVYSVLGKRFSQMNTKEFNEAKETIQSYFATKGLTIPDPRGNNTLNDFING